MSMIQVGSRTQGTRPSRIALVSECPRCGDERVQWYTPGAVQRLLNGGHPVEGYCIMCDEYCGPTVNQFGT